MAFACSDKSFFYLPGSLDSKKVMTIEISIADYEGVGGIGIKQIRNSVFSKEQKIDASLDLDGQDTIAVHVLATVNGESVGTGRMLGDGHIGRLAVLKFARGKGVGEKLVLKLLDIARVKEMKRVFLGAQEHAVGFYETLGFLRYGSPYVEAGIRHIHMEKMIHPPLK